MLIEPTVESRADLEAIVVDYRQKTEKLGYIPMMGGSDRLCETPIHGEEQRVRHFRQGKQLAAPPDAVEAASIADRQHVVAEPRDGILVVRPRTAQEEVDAGLVEDLGSRDDLLAALRRDLKLGE